MYRNRNYFHIQGRSFFLGRLFLRLSVVLLNKCFQLSAVFFSFHKGRIAFTLFFKNTLSIDLFKGSVMESKEMMTILSKCLQHTLSEQAKCRILVPHSRLPCKWAIFCCLFRCATKELHWNQLSESEREALPTALQCQLSILLPVSPHCQLFFKG